MTYFSIILPIHNAEDFINKSLDSIINQSFHDFEVICVNDGSTDSSLQILSTYNDPRIRVISQPNQGLSAARNTGLEIATGKYILFLDADDWLNFNTCQILYEKTLAEQNADIILFSFKLHQNDLIRSYKMPNYPDLKAIETTTVEFYSNPKIFMDFDFVAWDKAYKNTFIQQHNLKFEHSIFMAEDRVFSINLFVKNPNITFLDDTLYNYRLRNDSQSRKNYDFILPNMIKAFLHIEEQEYFYANTIYMQTLIIKVFLRDLLFWLVSTNEKAKLDACHTHINHFFTIIKKYRKHNLHLLDVFKELKHKVSILRKKLLIEQIKLKIKTLI